MRKLRAERQQPRTLERPFVEVELPPQPAPPLERVQFERITVDLAAARMDRRTRPLRWVMFGVPSGVKIYLSTEPTDMREDVDGLSRIVEASQKAGVHVSGCSRSTATAFSSSATARRRNLATLQTLGLRWTGEVEAVYNFGVDELRSYFVGELGAWVHNCDWKIAETRGLLPLTNTRSSGLGGILRRARTSLTGRN